MRLLVLLLFISASVFAGHRGTEILQLMQLEDLVTVVTDDCGSPALGYGSHNAAFVAKGKCVQGEAVRQLALDVIEFESCVKDAIGVDAWNKLNDNQIAALVIFAYNVGKTAFKGSDLAKCVKSGKLDAVPSEMRRWIHTTITAKVDGKTKTLKVVSDGLKNRREAEVNIWNTPVPDKK